MVVGYVVDGLVTGALSLMFAIIFGIQMYWSWERTTSAAAAHRFHRASPVLPSRNRGQHQPLATASGGGGGGGAAVVTDDAHPTSPVISSSSGAARRQPLIRYYFHRLGLLCAVARMIGAVDLYGVNGLYGIEFRILWSHSFPVLLFVVALAIWVHETVVSTALCLPPSPCARSLFFSCSLLFLLPVSLHSALCLFLTSAGLYVSGCTVPPHQPSTAPLSAYSFVPSHHSHHFSGDVWCTVGSAHPHLGSAHHQLLLCVDRSMGVVVCGVLVVFGSETQLPKSVG
jgi:hypothetical protein